MKKQLFQIRFGFMILLSLALSTKLTAQISQKTDQKKSYAISDGSQFVPKAYYPKFSWNTTPMYYHFGDINRVLRPAEVKFIAERTNFITIEKAHAYKMLGDAVLGAKSAATAFRKIKPGIRVLFYFNSFVAWPFTRFNQNFTPDRMNKHPDLKEFLIFNPKTGEYPYMKRTKPYFDVPHRVYYFDVLNPGFRQWFVASVVEGVRISGSNGVFIDRMNPIASLDFRKNKTDEIVKAKGEMMAALKKELPDKILLGNNAAENKAVFPSCDAFMFEHFNASLTTKEKLLKDWGDMLKIAKAGKISVFRFSSGRGPKTEGPEEWSRKRLDFFLACYLIGAQPYSYFEYNWNWTLSGGDLVNYPELLKPLGPPKGPYKRVTPEGWVFTREFEHARVWVDTEKREAKITWR